MLAKFKGLIPYILGFFVVTSIIFYPELQGKKLGASDAVTWVAASKEFKDYKDKGESILWTNRIFSGMPLYTVSADISGNIIFKYTTKILGLLPNNISNLFLVFICCFVSLIVLGIDKRLAFVLSIAFGLNTWVLDSLWASHPTKILSYAFMLPVYAGFIAFMKDNKLIGIILILLGINFSIAYGHYQIVYYGAIVNIIFGLYFLYEAIVQKSLLSFFKKSALVIAAVLIGLMTNISSLLVIEDYNKETMRGGKSELVRPDSKSTGKEGGLDINYAFNWSYTVNELLNFIVPDALGGSNNYKIKTSKSKIAQAINPNEDEQVVQFFYWGIQPFTGAPNYLGIATMFLFVFSLFYWQNRFKYVLLGIFFLSVLMGLGKSFLGFNELLFNYLPMYNKFRTPTMSFSILNSITILLIGLAMNSFLKIEEDKERLIKCLKYSLYTILGLMLVGFVMISSEGYSGPNDTQTFANNKGALELIIEDRTSLLKSDLFRSFVLAILLTFSFYYYIKNKLSKQSLVIVLGVLIFLDLYFVHKRYLSADVFEKVENTADLISNESYNQYLEQDKSHFRIFNTTNQNIFNDNTDGYRFSNIGGYSPAKLYRYQDLIDAHIGRGSMSVFNMLNTKYLIVDNNGQKTPQQNPDACGNAWFINEIKFAKNANEEMDSIGTFNPKNTVWIDQRFKSETDYKVNSDPNANISLSKYHPDNMEYTSSSISGGFVVFSEIWYKGNEDWNLYVNGKSQKLVRVNYLLRGAYIPAGNNKIEMKFNPKQLRKYISVSVIFSIILLMSIIAIIYKNAKSKNKD